MIVFDSQTNNFLQIQANVVYNLLKDVAGLHPVKPKGAFYMMVGIDHTKLKGISSCREFMNRLANEQSVFVFPGQCFNYSGYFRIVLTAPEDILVESCERVKEFCSKYSKE
jgi:tyrosine aminotransferase